MPVMGMARAGRSLLAGASSGLLLARAASANDSEMGGQGMDLVPLKNTSVQMVSEDIVLEQKYDASNYTEWQITARYHFRNAGEAALDVQMGFPETHCPPDPSPDCHGEFQGMRTKVRSAEVKHRVGRVSASHPWAKHFGPVWIYDVRFAAGEDVEVVHQYGMDSGNSVMNGTDITYVTRTGAMWNGPIGHARFTFRFSPGTLLLDATSDPPLASSERTAKSLELVFEAKEWNPQGDLTVAYAGASDMLEWGAMPEWTSPSAFDWKAGAKRAGLAGTASCAALTEVFLPRDSVAPDSVATELVKSGADLRLCRNAIFARRGRIFSDPQLNLFFYGSKAPQGGPRRHFIWQPNPDFEQSELSDSDWKALKIVDRAAELAQQPVTEPEPARSPTSEAPMPSVLSAKPESQGHAPGNASGRKPAGGCGCDIVTVSSAPSQGLWLLSVLGMLLWRRRQCL